MVPPVLFVLSLVKSTPSERPCSHTGIVSAEFLKGSGPNPLQVDA